MEVKVFLTVPRIEKKTFVTKKKKSMKMLYLRINIGKYLRNLKYTSSFLIRKASSY